MFKRHPDTLLAKAMACYINPTVTIYATKHKYLQVVDMNNQHWYLVHRVLVGAVPVHSKFERVKYIISSPEIP